ncbi:pentatricopeptide repeat (PPR) superfamily protein [Actinidia rufa]|uniref:Pentatricopeptide repeat (PPR) superfamily protein n=1 Tax=Actinidia rufa TaxID=165716 RepID=A0A7J0GGF5_9ERIC|nr:pentatricopeptide repeat (PPR) superfamily protein [Actinidia rufa]
MPERLAHASSTSVIVHSQSLKLGFGSKGKLGNAIVDLYAKCGDLEFAEKAFNQLQNRDAIRHFGSMLNYGVSPNQFTFAVLLSACARLMDAEFGKQVHCNVIKTGFEFNSFCEGSLVDMYAKLNNVIDARRIFDGADNPDTVSWTAIIAGYVQIGLPEEALKLFEEMQKRGRFPDQVAFVTVISAFMELGRLDDACCLFSQMPNPNTVAWNVMISGHAKRGYEWEAVEFFQKMSKAGVKSTRSTLGSVLSATAGLVNLEYGLQVHAHAMKHGLNSNVYVGSSLVNMYAKCGKMEDAKKAFDPLDEKNVVLWNAILGGYAQNGYATEVVELFFSMRLSGFHPDEFTYTGILSACGCSENLGMGRQLHASRHQFELMRNRDNVSWNAIIVGYVQEEIEDEAFKLFQRMNSDGISSDEVSLAIILNACANLQALGQGKQVHCLSLKHGLETSLYSGSSLIDMYAKCGAIDTAYEVFISMPERSVVSTNALIAGGLSTLNLGRQIHCFILKEGFSHDDDFLGVSLLGMYMNSHGKTDASILFSDLPNPKSAILWTAIISGHAQNDCSEEALQLYRDMRRDNVMPDQGNIYQGWYFQAGGKMKLGMSINAGVRTALATWASWIENMVDTNKTHLSLLIGGTGAPYLRTFFEVAASPTYPQGCPGSMTLGSISLCSSDSIACYSHGCIPRQCTCGYLE